MNNTIKIFLALLIVSCNSWKSNLKYDGTKDEARINAILDFANCNKLSRNKMFLVGDYEETKDLYCFKFRKNKKILPELTDSIGGYPTYSFPTKYIEINNKLFLWEDSKSKITKEIVGKMQEYKSIDSSYYKINNFVEIINTGDFKKEYFYFICKKNISKYEKTKAIWIDKVNYPKVDCNE